MAKETEIKQKIRDVYPKLTTSDREELDIFINNNFDYLGQVTGCADQHIFGKGCVVTMDTGSALRASK